VIHGTAYPIPVFSGAPLSTFEESSLRRTVGAVVGSLVGLLLSWTVVATSFAADHLLLTEFAVTPTDGEFIEIYNPTGDFIDLSEYYVSDFVLASVPSQNYWRIVNGTLVPDPAFPNDFLAKFPDGSTIAPGQTIVISLHDDAAFSAECPRTSESFPRTSSSWTTARVTAFPR
jgi:hypothetical protein